MKVGFDRYFGNVCNLERSVCTYSQVDVKNIQSKENWGSYSHGN